MSQGGERISLQLSGRGGRAGVRTKKQHKTRDSREGWGAGRGRRKDRSDNRSKEILRGPREGDRTF